jgi:hypothetical protein
VIYARYGKMRSREVLKMRKMKEFPVIKLMLTTVSKGELDSGVMLCFRYIVMRENNFRRHRNEEKEKTG